MGPVRRRILHVKLKQLKQYDVDTLPILKYPVTIIDGLKN